MYCNKCGKKNADNINFCVHCGAKMDVENQSVMQKKVIMKCIECGKTFENGTKFCHLRTPICHFYIYSVKK